MNAGIVDHETGTMSIRDLGGLWKMMPFSGGMALVAGASMAGFPPLNGFLSKEMFLEESLHLAEMDKWPWIIPLLATVATLFSVAYSIRYVKDVYFGETRGELPRQPHDPPWGMRFPMVVLVLLCVLIGLAPASVAGPLVGVAAGGVLGEILPAYKLALWHGLNLPLLLSAVAMAGGVFAYAQREKIFHLQDRLLPPVRAERLYQSAISSLVRGSVAVTSYLQRESLQRHLAILVVVSLAAAGLPFYLLDWQFGAAQNGAISEILLAAWIIITAGAVGTALTHRNRLLALVLVGIVGLVVSLLFVYFSAPDLALTQISVEVVTIVLLLLALKRLPRHTPVESSRLRRFRDGTLAVGIGSLVTFIVWLVLTHPLNSISTYHLENSKSGGGGYNVVNVILVDFRGFDTFGEIIVLAIAALAIYAMIDKLGISGRWQVGPEKDEIHYPLVLVVITRLLLPLALVVAIYMLLRGHNAPGGGFIAGLITSVAFILQYIASGIGWTQARLPQDYHPWIAFGVLTAGFTGVGSWLFGHPFLTSWFDHFDSPITGQFELATALVFDVGVCCTVVGATLLVLVNIGKVGQAPGRRETKQFQERK